MHACALFALIALLLFPAFEAKADNDFRQDSLLLRYGAYSAWFAPEKVYLHFDRSCYVAGETIWFKGWVQEASAVSQLSPSNYMYAEVLDSHGDARVRVKIKRQEGGFPGCMDLPDNLETGDYTIRAYTLWQLNYDDEFHFHDKIRIIGGSPSPQAPPEEKSEVQLSFYPEGGRYFAGHKSVIGFKAVDNMGRSVEFSGVLVGGGLERMVSTVHDGMGSFEFLPEAGESYGIRDASGKVHPLPAPAEEGAAINLWSAAGRYYINTIGFGGGEASLLERDNSRQRPLAQLTMDGEMSLMMVRMSSFSPGINHLLIVNSHGQILAERLFYVRDKAEPLCLYDGRSVSLTDPAGTPLDGTCSVSIVSGFLEKWQQSEGISSYLGLSSELKGRINNPDYYFDQAVPLDERDAAMDLLMMIQGWRYYHIEEILDPGRGRIQFRHNREYMQEIRGHISRWISSRVPKNFTFTFIIPKYKYFQSIKVAKAKEFLIDSLDFPENTEFMINIGTSRLGAIYLPKWDGDQAAKSYIYKAAPGTSKDSWSMPPLVNEFAMADTLQAAVVSASYEPHEPLVFGRSYRDDLEMFKEQTLVEYLSMKHAVFEYDGENMYNRSRMRVSSSSSSMEDESLPDFDDEDKAGKVKLIVDDSEEAWWSFDMLRLEDLRSLNISTRPDPFYGGDGGVVHITLKPIGIRRSVSRNPSLLYFVPLGYQKPRCFEPVKTYFGQIVRRNTLLWSPEVKITGGRAPIKLPQASEAETPCVIRIEGLSADGRPFSCHQVLTPSS